MDDADQDIPKTVDIKLKKLNIFEKINSKKTTHKPVQLKELIKNPKTYIDQQEFSTVKEEKLEESMAPDLVSEENNLYDIFEASDGLLAIEFIKNQDFDLILCDIKMPKMDGLEVLVATKKIKPDIPIVMISGHGDLETADQD